MRHLQTVWKKGSSGLVTMHRRLQNLENNVAELRKMHSEFTLDEIKDDKTKEWALRYGLLESIQIVIDLSCHIVAHHNLGNAETYSDCIKLLKEFDILDKELMQRLINMAGLRNILVHEYVEIDIDQLFEMLNHLDDFTIFAHAVKDRL